MAAKDKPQQDASLDLELNGVRMPDGSVVTWVEAHPRPELNRKESK